MKRRVRNAIGGFLIAQVLLVLVALIVFLFLDTQEQRLGRSAARFDEVAKARPDFNDALDMLYRANLSVGVQGGTPGDTNFTITTSVRPSHLELLTEKVSRLAGYNRYAYPDNPIGKMYFEKLRFVHSKNEVSHTTVAAAETTESL